MPFYSPRGLPHPGIKPGSPVSPVSPALAGGFFTIVPSAKPFSLDCGFITHFLESLQLHIHHSKARFQDKPFNITVIQVYAPNTNAKEAKVERFYEDLQDLLELTPRKDILFIIGNRNAKVGSQEIPGVTGKVGFGVQNEAGQRLIEFCQKNTLVIVNTLFNNTREDSTHGPHQMVIPEIILLYYLQQRWRRSIQSEKTRPGDDCGSDHKLLIAKFRLKLKKAGKTIRPFRYDLNQIPFDYTVEVTNRVKGLDLIDRVPEEL